MSNLESPQEFLFIYTEGGQEKKATVFGKNARDALYMFNTTFVKGNKGILVTGVYKQALESMEDENWERNVQILRVEFPPLQDAVQDEEAALLAKIIQEFLQQRFLGSGYRMEDGRCLTNGVVSLGGFYRADSNWDNIDQYGSCVNTPNRGSGDNEP